jgi:transposase
MPYTKKYEATLYNKKWLLEKYVEENMNAAQIAELIGCNKSATRDALIRFNIPLKTTSEAQKVAKYNRGSKAPRPRNKFKSTLSNPAWLRQQFKVERKTITEIAKEIGSSVTSVQRSLRKIGITKTKHSSPLTQEQLFRHRSYREARLMYPAKPCMVCGTTEKHSINHIDGNALNNNEENIEHLCLSHHLMVDKRLAARTIKWFRKTHLDLWLQWHEEVVKDLKSNPNPLPRYSTKANDPRKSQNR